MKTIDFLKTITKEENIEDGMWGIFIKDTVLLKEDIKKLLNCEDFDAIQGTFERDGIYINIKGGE